MSEPDHPITTALRDLADQAAPPRIRVDAAWRTGRRRRQAAITSMAAAAVAAVAAVLLAVGGTPASVGRTPASTGGTPAGNARPRVDAAAARVLLRAALAALQLQAGAPRPDQFVYTKLFTSQEPSGSGAGMQQTWASVDGARLGLQDDGPGDSGALPACRDGFWVIKAVGHPAEQTKLRCTATENAAYKPAMPTSVAALRGYLHKLFGLDPGDSGGLLTNIETMMTTSYLTSAQRAALYRLLAQTPGLTVVPQVTNIRGQVGVGVRSGVYKGSIYTIIFSRATYAPLGMNWTGIAGPMKGTRNGEVLLKLAIVSNIGRPLP